MKRHIELGILFSRTGGYVRIAEASRSGALRAISEVNADPRLDVSFSVVERDPGGNADAYGPLCEEIVQTSTARHVIGCVTSWSRKEVIPSLEKVGGTLWYAVPYEGFEASDHVVYTHACPNQHLLPLLGWCFEQFGRRGYLTGSNYIWGWEMSRLAREVIVGAGGEVLGERYLPIGATGADRIIDEIRDTRPDFVLNNLIGPSQYDFLEAYYQLGREDPHFSPATCPVLSCNLTECELGDISAPARQGLVAAGPYFRGEFGWPGERWFDSSHAAAAWSAVHELARLLHGRPGAEDLSLRELLAGASSPSRIDAKTHHTTLPVLIARVNGSGFDVVARRDDVAADPYLSQGRDLMINRRARLRVVK